MLALSLLSIFLRDSICIPKNDEFMWACKRKTRQLLFIYHGKHKLSARITIPDKQTVGIMVLTLDGNLEQSTI